MHAIDEVKRIKRYGWLTFSRHSPSHAHPDLSVVEEVAITLRSPTDPQGHCVEEIVVRWTSNRTMGSLIPSIYLEGGQAKLVALFPQILTPFLDMNDGHLTPDALIQRLLKVGVSPSRPGQLYLSPTVTCSRCNSLYRKSDCTTPDPQNPDGVLCVWCVFITNSDAAAPEAAHQAHTDFAEYGACHE